MKIKLIIISVILLLVMVFASGCVPIMEKLGLVSPTNEEQLTPEKGGPPDGLVKVLIGFKEKPGPPEQALIKGLGGKIKYTYNLIPAIAASVPDVAIEALKKNPNITNIELDSKVYALDTELDNSWGVKRIGAGLVHDSGNNGEGIKIAIIDTGIDYDHPDLAANYAGGYDFVNKDNDPMDDDITYGHGTHVSGIVAALDNGSGVVGVAPKAKLYALKVLDDSGTGYVSDVVFAIQWATDPDGDGSANDRLDIINMSLGGRKNIFLEWACNLAYLDGLLLVAAAGNDEAVCYPAAYSRVIAVSATDYDYMNGNDILANFSSVGPEVELAAPGVNINSTLLGGGYVTHDGTSMASPHVAGTAALVWAENPSWSNKDVRKCLQNSAEDINLLDTEQGYGLVDAENAVLGTTNGNNLPTQQATGVITGTVTIEDTTTPIEGAKVTADGFSTFTDDGGDYTLANLPVDIYTVTASKTGYTEGSQVAEVLEDNTTFVDFALNPEPTPTDTMHIHSIDMSLKTAGPNVNAIAEVTIRDESDTPVEGAAVSGIWSEATSDTDSGVTGTDGKVSFKSNKVKNPPSGTKFTFTVDDVIKDGYPPLIDVGAPGNITFPQE